MTAADRDIAAALATAVRARGTEWCTDPRRCEGMLKDLIPGHPLVINVLVEAVEAGIVRDLLGHASSLPAAIRIGQCVERLHDSMGIREDLARRAVVLWATALGIEVPPDVRAAPEARAPVAAPAEAGPRRAAIPPPPPAPTARKGLGAAAVVVACVAGAIVFVARGRTGGGGDAPPPPDSVGAAESSPTADTRQPAPTETPTVPPPALPAAAAPRATALRVAGDRPHKAGDDVEFTVSFSRPVTVTGRPRIGFRVGNARRPLAAVFARGDGTDRLTFLFEVPEGGVDGTGIALDAPAAIDLAGGGIVDAATGAVAGLALDPPPNLAAVRIDSSQPTVETVRPPTGRGQRGPGDRLEFRVRFDEPVEVAGQPALEFTVGGSRRVATWVGAAGSRTLEFGYTVAAEDEATDGVAVTKLLLAGGTIRDTAGNPARVDITRTTSEPFVIAGRPEPSPDPAGQAAYVEGRRLWWGEGMPIDRPTAHKVLKAAAAAGHPVAAVYVARSLEYGLAGQQTDQFEAADRWYGRALPTLKQLAERGDVDALYTYGLMISAGGAVNRDVPRAMGLLRRAADAGHAPAVVTYSELVRSTGQPETKHLEAVALLRTAVDRGSYAAMHELALRHLDGTGVAADEAEAYRLLVATIPGNAPEGIHELAHLVQAGRGCAKDEPLAARMLAFACTAQPNYGVSCLASCFFEGKGVDKDEARGLALLVEAATADPDLQLQLANRISAGQGVQRNEETAAGWYKKAMKGFRARAERGDCNAARVVGLLYAYGLGAAKDEAQARRWLEQAARSPFTAVAAEAATALESLAKPGNAS